MTGDGSKILKDDFYTMLMQDSEGNKGIRQPNLHKPGGATPTFRFTTEKERDNFINYLKTNFARMALSLYKNGQHLENGEMSLIPYLDFTQEWNDEKLFKKFNVSQELQDYIREFLPDYHGIR
jgi:site-specific DNA-methyltransferase (adenine-specific)